MKKIILILCLSTIFSLQAFSNSLSFNTWLEIQKSYSLLRIRNAISPSDGALGSVFASPSRSFPNYYYHWIRDAAIVYKEIFALRNSDEEISTKLLKDYIFFSRNNQLSQNLSGGPTQNGLGEPKFHMDGSAYFAPWGRPQNDGPALRAHLMSKVTIYFWNRGDQQFVFENLFRPELPAKTLLKADLEYTAHHWMDSSFDLWEEVNGDHFYTRMSQWKALESGAQIARLLRDTKAADFYERQAKKILLSLNNFWSTSKDHIKATINSKNSNDYKHSDLDIAVILAVNHVGSLNGPFGFTDERVLKTAAALENAFTQLYPLNNAKGLKLGPAIGRYPEDRYDGYRTDREGNPWFLTTLALAEFYYKLAFATSQSDILSKNKKLKKTLTKILHKDTKKKEDRKLSVRLLLKKGDSFLKRVHFHVDANGHLSEQFNRHNGLLQGARDLTWSYAAFLSCLRARRNVTQTHL